MTTPRDAIGLSERLRQWVTDWDGSQMQDGEPPRDGIHCDIIREAATALDALQARVKELEVEIPQLLTEQRRKLCAEHDKDITELNRVRRVSKEAIEAAESRATSAEQERDEAYERAAGVVDRAIAEFDDLLKREDVKSAPIAVECTRITMKALGELAAAIRRLAAGTEKERK